MQSIRRATKKHRTILTVVVILLLVGMVASFATWDSSSYDAATANNDGLSNAEYVDYYLEMVQEQTKDQDITTMIYGDAYSIAANEMQLYQYALSAYYDCLGSEDEAEKSKATTYQLQALTAASDAARYYERAVETIPDNVNDVAKAQLYAKLASAYLSVGAADQAQPNLEQALSIAPEDSAVVLTQASYLVQVSGYQAGIDYLNGLLANMKEDDANYASYSQSVSMYQLYQQLYESQTSTEGETGESAEPEAEPEAAPAQ